MTKDAAADTSEEFEQAVRGVLPILCFEPAEIEAFLKAVQAGVVAREVRDLECSSKRRALVGEGHQKGESAFIIPGDWACSYESIREAIATLQSEANRARIFMEINEGVPSHNSCFAGMLPGLGFTMRPGVVMVAQPESLTQMRPPELPDGFVEVALTAEQCSAAASAWHEAFATLHPEWLPEGRTEDLLLRQQILQNAVKGPSSGWLLVAHGREIVGVCHGSVSTDGDGVIGELGVVSAHRGLGLGR